MAKEDVKKTEEVKDESVESKLTEEQAPEAKKTTAKAGKRSEKGLKEAEEKQAKIEAQHHRDEDENSEANKPRQHANPTRTRLERKGKKYKKVAELVDKTKQYSSKEAIDLAIKTSTTSFDSSVELHARLNVDPKQADQNIRDSIVLPEGTGKDVRVAVFIDEESAKEAKSAGADIAGEESLLKQIEKGDIKFDILITKPNMMAKLSKHARVLGPKGLMPNPKSGTVTQDINKAISESKAGKVEYRVDSTGIIHIAFGKVSFGASKLENNLSSVMTSIKSNKPSSIKGTYVKSLTISTSMGPGIPLNPSELS